MKKYLAIFLLPLMAACTKGPKEAVILGTMQNCKDTVVYLSSKGITETIKLNADKTFEHKVSIDKPVLYTLKTGRRSNFEMYVNPGDTTIVKVDFENLKDGPTFSGKLAAENKNLVEKQNIVDFHLADSKEVFALSKESFYRKLDTLKNELNDKVDSIKNELLKQLKDTLLHKDIADTLLHKDIAALENIRTNYFINSIKAEYPSYNAYLKGRELNIDSADYSFLDGLDVNNSYYLMFNEYSELVNLKVTNDFKKEIGQKVYDSIPASERLSKLFTFIDGKIINNEVRDYLKQNSFMEDLSYGEFWKLTDLVNKFLADCQTVGYKSIIEKLYNKKMLLAPGKPAPLFMYKDINGKEYALEGLKGKLVYIDFWATWCGPCRHELPFLEEVEKAYQGKKITFISMSVDEDKVAWDKMVKEKKMMGLQLHADGAWLSTVATDYQIKGIPTFVLIDQNGVLISPSAPRPSQGKELTNLLDENLTKIK